MKPAELSRTLVIGAGWSVPFGGFLVYDFTERVMGHRRVFGSGELRRRFDTPGATFESVLADVVRDDISEDTENLNTAISDVFAAMNKAFLQTAADRERDHSHVGTFLAALANSGGCNIVSLNQDLWFELWSCLGTPRVHIAGVGSRLPPVGGNGWGTGANQEQWERLNITTRPVLTECMLKRDHINLIKVHGSSDWYIKGKPQMVVGGDKEVTIGNAPLLTRLQSLGNRAIQSASHLIVVGYGFRDAHINRELAKACYISKMELTVVDVVPYGTWYKQVNSEPRTFRDSENVRMISSSVRHYISAGMSAFGFWNSSLDSRLQSFAAGDL